MDDAVRIRSVAPGDAAAVAELSGQLGYVADAATMATRIERVQAAAVGAVFVAEDTQGRIVGWTHIVPRIQLEDAAYAELAGLVIDAQARGRGIGAALLAAAEDWARRQGFAMLRVRSNVLRERAHRFYLRAGYVERKRQVIFNKSLEAG